MDAIDAADQRTVMCPLFSGLFTGNTKYLWLSAMNITVELELADTYANIVTVSQGAAGAEVHAHSDDFHIQEVNLLGDVVHISLGIREEHEHRV